MMDGLDACGQKHTWPNKAVQAAKLPLKPCGRGRVVQHSNKEHHQSSSSSSLKWMFWIEAGFASITGCLAQDSWKSSSTVLA
jgi:hypothetical protein